MSFKYLFKAPTAEQALELYKKSEIYNKQWNVERMKLTLENSSLILSCYDETELIGIARGLLTFIGSLTSRI